MAFNSSQLSATARYVAAYQAKYLSHLKPVINHVGTNLYSLVNRELLGVSIACRADGPRALKPQIQSPKP